jgi:predicted nucleotide-binding protein (sugar kinase/HSP70/actin superfamily)
MADQSLDCSSSTVEAEILRRLEEERIRLRMEAGLQVRHFRRPEERPFTADERDKVTILFGGLTWKHEAFIRAVFHNCGYRCESLPAPDLAGFQLGKEFGNNGQCNPAYFTVGNLIQYLQKLEARGLTRQQIIDGYVFFTAGSCGPCRFGMYEAEYRYALKNAGFGGFRILLFQQADGIKATAGEAGLRFSGDFGLGALNALQLGDVVSDTVYQVRPYETTPGETDRVFRSAVEQLSQVLAKRDAFEFKRDAPAWMVRLAQHKPMLGKIGNGLMKTYDHLYGKELLDGLHQFHDAMNAIEVDRTRVKPVVKINGEFWAQITEGDGNFNMFTFLEREGAQVVVEPISTWVGYMMHEAGESARAYKSVNGPYPNPEWWEFRHRLANEMKFRKKWLALRTGDLLWNRFYERVIRHTGALTHKLVSQKELARLAHPFYHQLARGGEGHLEVGKSVYYTAHHLCHMVLGLKPFGCMPSSQSDGIHSAVVNRYREMIFLPIETSGEGEVNAHSRVQMALAEAKLRARDEFESVLKRTGKRLDDIHDFVADHPELRRALYPVPQRDGIAGTAAQFVAHVSDLMDAQSGQRNRKRTPTQVLSESPAA